MTQTRRISDPPGPKEAWFFGNALQLELETMHLQRARWALEHGPLHPHPPKSG